MEQHDEQVIAEALDVLQEAEETIRAEQWFRKHDGTWKPAHNPLGWKGMTVRGVEAAKLNLGVTIVNEHWVVTR